MASVPPTAATRCPFMRRILGRGLGLLVALALHAESAAISPRFSAVVLAEWCIPAKRYLTHKRHAAIGIRSGGRPTSMLIPRLGP